MGTAIRTNASLVQGILLGDYDSENAWPLTPFIAAGNVLCNRLVWAANKFKKLTLPDPVLLQIETWLAAYAYVQADQNFKQKSTAGASASYSGNVDFFGIKGSKYGQMALAMDWSNTLGPLTEGRIAGGFAPCPWEWVTEDEGGTGTGPTSEFGDDPHGSTDTGDDDEGDDD